MAEIDDELFSRVLVRFDALQKSIDEMAKENIHMAACFQEQSCRLEEFMRDHEERVRRLEQNCNREERWENNTEGHTQIWTELTQLNNRMVKIERAKCPKMPVLDELDSRIEAIERTHDLDTGAKTAGIEIRELIGWGLAGILSVITIYQILKGEL